MVLSRTQRSSLGEFNRSPLGELGSIPAGAWYWALFSGFKAIGSIFQDHYYVFEELGADHIDEIPKGIVSFDHDRTHALCGWERSARKALPRELFGLLRLGENDWVAFKPYDPNFGLRASVERGRISVASGIGDYRIVSEYLGNSGVPPIRGEVSKDVGQNRSGFTVDLVDMRDICPLGDTTLFNIENELLLTAGVLGSLDTPEVGAECHYRCRDQGLWSGSPQYLSAPVHTTYALDSRVVPGQQRNADWFVNGWSETQDVAGYIARVGVDWEPGPDPYDGQVAVQVGGYSTAGGSYSHSVSPSPGPQDEWARASTSYGDTFQGTRNFASDYPVADQTFGNSIPSKLIAGFSQSRRQYDVSVSADKDALFLGSIVGHWFTWTHDWGWLVLFLQGPQQRVEPSAQQHSAVVNSDSLDGSIYENAGVVSFTVDDSLMDTPHGIRGSMFERIFCTYPLPDPPGQYMQPSGAVVGQGSSGPAFEESFGYDDSARASGVPAAGGGFQSIMKARPQFTQYKNEVIWTKLGTAFNWNYPRDYGGFYLSSRVAKTMGDIGVATASAGIDEEKILRVGFPVQGWDIYDLETAGTVVDGIS